MGFFKSIWVKILTSIIFTAFIVGIGGYLMILPKRHPLFSFQPIPFAPTTFQPSPTPLPKNSDQVERNLSTVQWKTFTDTKQKYSITYPPNWSIFSNVVGGLIPGYAGTIINSASKLEPHGEILA